MDITRTPTPPDTENGLIGIEDVAVLLAAVTARLSMLTNMLPSEIQQAHDSQPTLAQTKADIGDCADSLNQLHTAILNALVGLHQLKLADETEQTALK